MGLAGRVATLRAVLAMGSSPDDEGIHGIAESRAEAAGEGAGRWAVVQLTFGFGYDGLSRRTLLTRSNGVSSNYTYDSLSRLLNVSHQLSGNTIDGASYVPDSVGNRTSKTDLRTQLATGYGYDAIYQLLSATQGGNATESYTYDPVGNRLSSLTVPTWVYNSSNELTATVKPVPLTTTIFQYDANGNLTSKSGGGVQATYTWDFENRLTSATVNGATTSFKYDPFGRRVYKSSSAAWRRPSEACDHGVEESLPIHGR